jgi:two-component system, NarL family, sensor histidine kinase DegS
MTNDSLAGASERFERIGLEATDSVRGDARRIHELAEQFRAQYRRDLDEWMQLRARLDRRGPALRPVGDDMLRAQYEHRGRELAALQSRLKRLDVVSRQLDVLWSYLESDDPALEEPSAPSDDETAPSVALRVVQAQEGERQRMAEDIHDGPAQVLTNALFQVEYLDRVIGRESPEARAELAFLRDLLRGGLDQVRGFIADLRLPAVDVRVADALADRAQQFEQRHGIAVELDIDGIDDRLTQPALTSVLRIVQEALQNVRKHAAASRVRVSLEGDTVVIADNGRGFDLLRLASGRTSNFGLQFMRERAELMGAQLQIESRQGEGTRILLRLPAQGARHTTKEETNGTRN